MAHQVNIFSTPSNSIFNIFSFTNPSWYCQPGKTSLPALNSHNTWLVAFLWQLYSVLRTIFTVFWTKYELLEGHSFIATEKLVVVLAVQTVQKNSNRVSKVIAGHSSQHCWEPLSYCRFPKNWPSPCKGGIGNVWVGVGCFSWLVFKSHYSLF